MNIKYKHSLILSVLIYTVIGINFYIDKFFGTITLNEFLFFLKMPISGVHKDKYLIFVLYGIVIPAIISAIINLKRLKKYNVLKAVLNALLLVYSSCFFSEKICVYTLYCLLISFILFAFFKNKNLYKFNVCINSFCLLGLILGTFNQVDLFPSIVEAIGIELPNHKLGIETSIFSDEKTLIERYSDKELKELIDKPNKLYDIL